MKNRLVNYDLLRIFAAYLIIMLHLSVQYIHQPPSSFEAYQQWEYALAFSAFSRVGVPVFIMLSGLFLLNPQKQITISMVYTKYLPKLLLIFVCWSFFYAFSEQNFFHTFWEMTKNPSISASFSDRLALCWGRMDQDFFWESVIKGHYHMWYLYMLAGLYLITPLLRVFTEHATKIQFLYFIVLCVVITSITKLNDALWKSELFSQSLDTLALTFVFGYVGYFIAGYFLDSVFGSNTIKSRKHFRLRNTGEPNRGKEFFLKGYTAAYNFLRRLDKPALLLYVLGIAAYLFTFFGTKHANPMFGFKTPDLTLFSNYSPTVFLMSFSIFALAAKAKNCTFPIILKFLANKLPQYMLTVYMIHPFIISEVRRQEFVFKDTFPLALPLQSFVIFLISLGISIVLMHIYYLGRRLVRFRSK